MRFTWWLLVALCLSWQARAEEVAAYCEDVASANTVVIAVREGTVAVRISNLKVDPSDYAAKAFLLNNVKGRYVTLVYSPSDIGRSDGGYLVVPARIILDGKDVAGEMKRRGLAKTTDKNPWLTGLGVVCFLIGLGGRKSISGYMAHYQMTYGPEIGREIFLKEGGFGFAGLIAYTLLIVGIILFVVGMGGC